jgi:hypothetical protein
VLDLELAEDGFDFSAESRVGFLARVDGLPRDTNALGRHAATALCFQKSFKIGGAPDRASQAITLSRTQQRTSVAATAL